MQVKQLESMGYKNSKIIKKKKLGKGLQTMSFFQKKRKEIRTLPKTQR
jgi:hypothetical protein